MKRKSNLETSPSEVITHIPDNEVENIVMSNASNNITLDSTDYKYITDIPSEDLDDSANVESDDVYPKEEQSEVLRASTTNEEVGCKERIEGISNTEEENEETDGSPDALDEKKNVSMYENQILKEIDFNLEEIPAEDSFVLKKRNDVYYEMYREAMRKAKMAKEMAVSSYLEAKRIKNIYMLEDLSDEESDEDEDEEEEV